MSKYKVFLYIAAGLVLFTFLGHTMGSFQMTTSQIPETAAIHQMMEQTMEPMPIGPAKSYKEILLGAMFCLSVYLLISGIALVLFARNMNSPKSLIWLTAFGLLLTAILSVRYFFPLPAICLGAAAILAVVAVQMREKKA